MLGPADIEKMTKAFSDKLTEIYRADYSRGEYTTVLGDAVPLAMRAAVEAIGIKVHDDLG